MLWPDGSRNACIGSSFLLELVVEEHLGPLEETGYEKITVGMEVMVVVIYGIGCLLND